ncbi:hypothetical protein CU098_005198 [Rhizopus stolonifer]|uniref:Glutathione hydrolase n=1 Tax=Rhizopus stolonifer TaxID=4846 RepID=A0A367KRD0_RHIST|nr:hypothetical protein CU098_005198 [Rhizopus stolonifer]
MPGERQSLIAQNKKRTSKIRKYSYVFATAAVLSLGSALLTALIYNDVPLDSPVQFRGQIVKGSKGAVAVETKECSDVGVQILQKGGNAVDAAIASALCIGVINNFATGIGGGGFMLIRSPNGTFEFIDFRETAPAAASKDMFVHDPMLARIGGLSVGIPGEIRGLELAHKRHGKLPWATLFEPSIRLADDGFKTTDLLSIRIEPAKKGDVIRRPKLAQTLDKIAKNGANSFYEGEIAESLVKKIQSTGGIATLDDFKNYKPVIRPTISTYYNGRKITTCSEPTSGRVLLSMLNLVERFQFKTDGLTGLNVHRLIEAFKFGFAFRTELGDPKFIYNNERKDEIATKDFAASIRRKITDNETHGTLYYGPRFDHSESHGTMHLSVVDENDGAVALTSTVNLLFGSHVLDEQTGIVLNDQMDDFSIPGTPNMFGLYPSEYNYVEPYKRPLSSTTPTIIEMDSAFEIAIGGSGGSMIPTITLNAIINILEYGKDLYSAVASPRLHHQLLPDIIIAENGYSKKIKTELKNRNHTIFDLPMQFCSSAVQAVRRNPDGTVEAASDPRKMGMASAY